MSDEEFNDDEDVGGMDVTPDVELKSEGLRSFSLLSWTMIHCSDDDDDAE